MHGFDLGRLLPPTDRRPLIGDGARGGAGPRAATPTGSVTGLKAAGRGPAPRPRAASAATARSIPRCRAATVHRLGAVGTNRRQPTTTLTATVGSVIGMVVPRLEAKVGGQAQRRGLIPRTPSGERLLADATIWLTGEYPDAVRSTRQRSLESGATALAIDLHPAAPPLIITAEGAGRITVVAETAQAGPGYHRFVGRMLERLGSEIGIEWTHGDGATTFADRPTVERAYLGWLGPQLTRARVAFQRGQRGVHVGMPPAIRVTTDAALATVLGPREEAWLDAAIADPRVPSRSPVVGRRQRWQDPAQSGARADVAGGALATARDRGRVRRAG